jgi:NAD(P)-dependent dehydrogenase (short-subunit alcohol dehydrogenase family)
MKGKWVLVTGSTRGIGLAIAKSLSYAGLTVVSHGRSMRNELTEPALFWEADFNKPEEALHGWRSWLKRYGCPMLLVNNAGHFERDDILSPIAWARCLNVNFHTPRLLTSELVKHIGSPVTVVNIISTAALHPREDAYSYSESKRLLMNWMQQLRKRMAGLFPDFRIINIYPGPVLTEAWQPDEPQPERMLRPEDIANSIISLLRLSDRLSDVGTDELIITA